MPAASDKALLRENTPVGGTWHGSRADARAHVHDVVRRAGSSFFWAMRTLASEQREAVYAIYAFCREVDDIADEEGPAAEKLQQLQAWRQEIGHIYGGTPNTPTGQALADVVNRFGLPREEFLRLIDAVEIDANTVVHAPTMAELQHYCRGVAGAVGMLLIRVFGARGPTAEAFAIALGEALQLTNILRDVAEDGDRGRVYLPAEVLHAAGVDVGGTAREILCDVRLPDACRALAGSAEHRFQESDRLLEQCDRKALKSALIMKDVYRKLLERLIESGWRDIRHPVRVGSLFKLSVALRHALF